MTTRMEAALAAAVVLGLAVAYGVGRSAHARAARHDRPAAVTPTPTSPPPAATAATAAVLPFADARSGITLAYPAAWHAVPAKTAELSVAAPAAPAVLSLDVPPMPYHPFYIPLAMVQSSYLDDLRHKRLPDAVVQESTDVTVAGATARRLTARGHAAPGVAVAPPGTACVDTAVLIVHDRQVYILSCDSTAAAAPVARAALDAAAASVHWTK